MTIEEVTSPVLRTTLEIIQDIQETAPKGDIKRLRELSGELLEAQKREQSAELTAKAEELKKALDPVKAQIVRIVERPEFLEFLKVQGGVFSFSYHLPVEGSDKTEADVNIQAGSRAVAAPRVARTPTASNGGSTGGGRGNVYVVGGQRLSLSDAFNALATEEDKASKQERMDKAGTDKSRNSAGWAVMSRVVNKAVEAGAATIEAGS